jgi:hypothetical protein
MLAHFKRNLALYLTLLALIPLPLGVIQSRRLPPLDRLTILKFAKRHREAFIRQHPKARVARYDPDLVPQFLPKVPEQDRGKYNHKKEYRIQELISGGMAATEAMRPDLEAMGRLYDSSFRRWDAEISHGLVFLPFFHVEDYLKGRMNYSEFISISPVPFSDAVSKIRRAEAALAMREQRWSDALELLESCAHFADPLRYKENCAWLSVSCRAGAYVDYESLLRAAPPRHVSRRALASLASLRESEPIYDDWTFQVARLCASSYPLMLLDPAETNPVVRRRYVPCFLGSLLVAVESKDKLGDPRLQAWAKHLDRQLSRDNSTMLFHAAADDPLHPVFGRWTFFPSACRFLNEVSMKSPWLYQSRLLPESDYRDLDHWTLMMFGDTVVRSISLNPDLLNMWPRRNKTLNLLLEAAFAARIWRDEHGAWPRSMHDVEPLLPKAKDDPSTCVVIRGSSFPITPYRPVQLAERKMTDELKVALWSRVLPTPACIPALPYPTDQPTTTPMNYLQAVVRRPDDPIPFLASEQALRAHPRLVESVKLEVSFPKPGPVTTATQQAGPIYPNTAVNTVDPNTSPTISDPYASMDPFNGYMAPPIPEMPLDQMKWESPDPAYLRHVTDESDSMPYQTGYPGSSPKRQYEPPQALRLTAKLRAPEKVMVIWSPGPDGVDDGGRFSYDPTNGTISAGVLLVFPEQF